MNAQHRGTSIEVAVKTLQQGGLIAYPTEAVYGLGCDPGNNQAIQHLLDIKQRDKQMGLILIAASFEHLQPYLLELSNDTRQRIFSEWPGATTWLLPAKPDSPTLLRGKYTSIAVRITDHPLAKQLCEQWHGALISTSANISTQTAARNSDAVEQAFGQQVDFILDGEVGNLPQPTQIKDGQTGQIIRN